jgi:hypothetical protein
MTCVVMFVVIMDILKYCFGIDPVGEELERIRREKRARNRKLVAERVVNVNASPSSEQLNSSVAETAV